MDQMNKLGTATPQNKLGQMKLGIQDTEEIRCEKCGHNVFEEGVMLRRVSALITGQGKPGVVPIPTFQCASCGHVNKEFLPVINGGEES